MIIPPDSNYKKNSIIIHPPSNDGGGPGIGAARYATCGSITFNRGNVTAYGFSAPGIGVTTDGKKCGKITFNRAIGDVHAITDSGTCISPSDKVVNNCRFLNGYVDKTYAGLPEKNDHVIDDPNATTRTIGSPLGEIRSNKTYKNNTIDGGSYFIPCNDLGYYLGDNHSPEGHYLLAGNERRSKAPEIPCLRGALSGDYRISIADGAIVELFDVTIGPSLTSDIPGITCNGNATIILYGDNYVAGHGEQYPGIYVPHGKTVTFIGPGSLTAVGGGDYGVGIGSCGPKKERGGNVEIVSGNITAIGGKYAPALGGTFLVQDGDETTLVDHAQYVYIRNGTVHTKGGVWEESDHFVVENHMDRTRSGNEEFFRWNGELDNLPVGPWIYAVAHNGTVIRGSLPMTNEDAGGYLPLVTIAPDAEVELYGASLYADIYRVKIPWHTLIKEPRIGGGVLRCEGNATIKLSNDPRDYNVIKSKNETCPGIVVPEGATLTFTGDGSLRVQGGENSCAIRSKGTVVFDGGDVHVFDWPWDSSAPIENSSCQILWGGNYVFKRGSMQLYCDIDKNSKPPEISRFFYEDASREFGKGMVRKTGTQEWTAAPGEFEKGYWRCDITWDGSLDDLGDEEQASGMKMKAMSALPARKAAGLLGTRSFEDLEDVDSDAIAGDGTVITGTLSGRHKISIAHGATVTLRDVTINPNGYDSDSSPYAGLTCLGDATIVLEGTNNITSFNSYFPAISSAAGCELTIEGAGNLYASGGDYAAAIGGGYGKNCGSIVIKGGDIDAYGGVDSNVIGSGKSGYCESVSVASGISRLVLNKGESGLWGITDVSSAITYKSEGTNKRIYKWSGNLSSVSAADAPVELTALDGTTITGSNTSGGYKKVNVKIAPGARVTLDSVTIDASTANLPNAEFLGTVAQWAGITCLGDAEITLVGENRVDSFNCEYPCVYVPKGSTLTIKGSGSLLADNTRNHARGAGIGGGSRKGINNDCGRIIIDGGTVHGYSNGSSTDSGYADGLGYSAGIGSGPDGWCAGVEIGSGITEVRGMNNAGVNMSPNSRPQLSAAPIGGGARGSAQVYPAHGLTDNYISTWADRVLRAIPRVDLSQATGDVTISMDSIVTGRLPGEGQYKVTIKAGAEVTLKDVTIYGQGAGIYCAGNASVWIEGMNYIQGQNNYPGIYVPKDWALNIYAKSASDYLEARGGSNAAGIGAGKGGSDGFGNAGSIWIHGGHVVATGGSWGAGIGTGSSTANGTKSNCDYIGIDGGSVLATGGGAAAGIGSGMNSTCGDIYISSNITRVVAVRGHAQAAHIGRGYNGSSGAISIDDTLRETIEGNTRTLEYNPDIDLSSIIGTASDEDELEVLLLDTAIVSGKLIPVRRIVIVDGATVTLRDVTITGTYNSAYNGQCEWAGITCEGDATIILEGTNNVTGYYENYPGIYVPPRGTLTIKGDGVLNASGSVGSADSKWAPGIGGGYMIDGGSIVIDGGIVKATGGKYAAGIGGGRSASIGTIEINGGSVVTEGGEGSPGIGAGAGSSCEGVSIGKGISFVSTTGGVDGSAEVSPIGPSEDGTCAKMSIAGALVQVADGNSLTIMPAKMDLGRVFDDVVVQNGMTLTGTLETRCKISVAPDAHITLKDAVIPGTNAVGDSWAGLTCTSNATIVLEGENTVRSHGQNNGYPGIYVPEGSTLAIEGEGSLTVETSEDNWGGAGIGGGSYLPNCGNITINGGVVVARSYHWAAGIGGGGGKRCGTISIGPGIKSVTATCAAGNEPIGAAQSMTFDGLEVDSSLIDATSADGLTRTIKSPIVDLSTLNEDFVLPDKAVATGALAANVKISIAAGATVTLHDATINGVNDENYTWAGITCEGDATIILEGSNTVKGFYEDYPGVYVPEGCTLTIRGDGSLDASSNGWAAGIGAGRGIHCGNIVIDGGSVNAVGGEYSAGIGGASRGNCGDIAITRNVTSVCATKGPYNSHSIGAGSGSVGTVTIGGGEGAVSISPFVYKPWNGNLDTLDGDVTVANGTIVTGTLDGGYAIYLEDGATNYLYNATINGKLVCKGSATIVISGDNIITSTDGAAITVPANHQADIIGNGKLLATGTAASVHVFVDSDLDCEVKDGGNTYDISPKASAVEEIKLSGYTAWATEKGLSGAWDATDANGVANVFRYVFDVTDQDVTGSDFLGIEMGEDGRVVILTPEVVNGGVFNLWVVASDDPGGTENVVEYPLSQGGETSIDEIDMTSRFFRIRVDVK